MSTDIPPDALNVPWQHLTRMDNKRATYSVDADFRYGVHRMLRAGVDLRCFASRFAILMLKPEVFHSRKVNLALDFVRSRGFKVVRTVLINLTNAQISQLWRHQLNAATPCRLELIFNVLRDRPAMIALINKDATSVPTTVELSHLKGSGFPEKRDPSKLRGFLAGPNSYLNSAHVSDEPADVVRDMAILVPPPTFDDWLDTSLSPKHEQLIERFDRQFSGQANGAPFDLDPNAACERVIRQLSKIDADDIAADLRRAMEGEMFIEARSILGRIRPHRDLFDDWDLCLVISQFTHRTYANVSQSVGIPPFDLWRVDSNR